MLNEDVLFQASLKHVAYFCCGLPLGGFVACVLLALTLHFEGSTRTHCGVPNFLPSISSAIGDYTPERYVWRLCIALHSLPRFMTAFAYKNFFLSCPLRPVQTIDSSVYWLQCWLLCLFHVAENACLLVLSFVSSTDNYPIHKSAFILFMVFSLLYMMLHLYTFDRSGRRRSSSLGEKSYQYKLLLFCGNISAFLLSIYFFLRHNTYCEAGVTNILFHGTAMLDFHDKVVQLASSSSLNQLDWKAT